MKAHKRLLIDPISPAPVLSELYQICTRCIMDTTDPDIQFDVNGVCNHCHHYETLSRTHLFDPVEGEKALHKLAENMKAAGRSKRYDCILGVSGGVDSTYVCYLAKKLGLRPLAVHFDNGWNSEIAVRNIERTLKNLEIDLYTYVVDWSEFRDLQLSFLYASIENAEIPTDHGIGSLLYQVAVKQGVGFIITGANIATESILPMRWSHDYWDYSLLKAIHKRFGAIRLKTFPRCSFLRLLYYVFVKKIKRVCILDYVPFVKAEAMKVIESQLGWQYYGGKHYESIYTRFFQGYILPKKFGYDKRRAHLSSLVCAGQVSRAEALDEMKRAPYDPKLLREDNEYVLKKLGLSGDEFQKIMELPPKTYRDYPSDHWLLSRAHAIYKWRKAMKRK